jgi:hypothetical protein
MLFYFPSSNSESVRESLYHPNFGESEESVMESCFREILHT